MNVTYLLFRTKYGQNWGGVSYRPGSVRGIGMYVEQAGQRVSMLVWFGTSVTVEVDAEADKIWIGADEKFKKEEDLMEQLEPMFRFTSSKHGTWTFDDEATTPERLLKLGELVREGKNPRRWTSEALLVENR